MFPKHQIWIFAFSGKLGTGKDYLAQVTRTMLPPERNFAHLALADHFKIEAIAKDNLEFSKVFGDKDEKTRQALQHRGTEEGRLKYGEDIWTRTLENWMCIHAHRGVDTFLLTDIRFPDELAWLGNLSAREPSIRVRTIRLIAPQRNQARLLSEAKGDPELASRIASHISETALDDTQKGDFDLVLKNDPQDDSISPLRDLIEADLSSLRLKSVAFIDLDDTLCECGKYYMAQVEAAAGLITDYARNLGRSTVPIRPIFNDHFQAIGMQFEKDTFTRHRFADDLVEVARLTMQDVDLAPSVNVLNLVFTLGMRVHDAAFEPFPGAASAVREIQGLVDQVVIFTVGERPDQVRKLVGLGLLDVPCETFIHKDFTLFRVLMNKWKADHYVMIGDSLTRDIEPALEAGIDTIIHVSKKPASENIAGVIRVSSIVDVPENLLSRK